MMDTFCWGVPNNSGVVGLKDFFCWMFERFCLPLYATMLFVHLCFSVTHVACPN